MKTVLVNGGSRGIGAEIVRLFCEKGYRVAFTYHTSVTAADVLAASCGALAVCADSAVEEDVNNAVCVVRAAFGGIDILINCAAISSFSLFTDITTASWNRMFAVNVDGPFYYTRAVLPGMISQKWGRIINISSMWGKTGSACEVHYSATKAALDGMTRALAKEVGPSGITVNAVAPGVIDTDMNAALDADTRRALDEATPLCRAGSVREVAEAVLFLAGEGAAFITGQVIGVDGGFAI